MIKKSELTLKQKLIMKVHVIRLFMFSTVQIAHKAACRDDLDDDEFVMEVAESEPGVKSRRRRRRGRLSNLLAPSLFRNIPFSCTRTSA